VKPVRSGSLSRRRHLPSMQKDDTPATPPHLKGRTKKDGTPDMRCKANRAMKADGTPPPARPPPPEERDDSMQDREKRDRDKAILKTQSLQRGRQTRSKWDVLNYDPEHWAIPMCYQSGRKVQSKKPWNLESDAWYVDKDACFPPEFAEEERVATRYGNRGTEVCPVKAIARAEGETGETVRWGRKTYTLQEWCQQLANWQDAFPNIKRSDGSTPWETERFRREQTSNVKIIKQCFDKCKRPAWPDTLKLKASRDFLQRFRVDMWGNMICLPKTAGGLADNESLCFFDVDHTFPFSRGGRSVLKNFEALQCCANRWVKSDRLVQTLDPRAMLCGISAAQLLALVQWVEGGDEGEVKRKDVQALYRTIEGWLTVPPGHGTTFRKFQKDVKGSSDSSVLRHYFVARNKAWVEKACISEPRP
jgi:hypothetical protein